MDWQFEDIEDLQEGVDIEAKLAAGRDGKGELPKSFWETYSAMANAHGGVVLLGARELSPNRYRLEDISDPPRILRSLWDGLNNPEKASVNLLKDADVTVRNIRGQHIIQIRIPQADRHQRPVYINGNPMKGTYRRDNEGDYHCPEHVVNRMLAEKVDDARDAKMHPGFSFEDFDADSIKAYRILFQNRQPEHPWNASSLPDFMRNIGAWTVDRATGNAAPTTAGLLMFGKLRSILDAIPNYIVDYQERPRAKTEGRWVDRVTTDGSWSGNLFDFYRQVIRKLHQDLKVPFQLKGAERIEDTPVHVALREALVNTLIHADYSGRISVLVVKRPDMFGFRNPGGVRIPLDEAKRGGISDCRNRNLQKMFQLLGAGEQAGSGLPKIYEGWTSQHWRQPEFVENISQDREETLLRLRMVSLLPDETVEELGELFGPPFFTLPDIQRIALVTAAVEGSLTHTRLSEMTKSHPRDVSAALYDLVACKMLDSDGAGRGTYYFLPGRHPVSSPSLSLDNQEDRRDLGGSKHLPGEVQHLPGEVQHLDDEVQHLERLIKIAAPISETGKSSKNAVREAIQAMCAIEELSCIKIAELLNRHEATIQNHYLDKMCDEGLLKKKFPVKHHPKQRYRAE